jgi:hypothetical protein
LKIMFFTAFSAKTVLFVMHIGLLTYMPMSIYSQGRPLLVFLCIQQCFSLYILKLGV